MRCKLIFIISGKQHSRASLAVPQPRHGTHRACLGRAGAAHRQRASPPHGCWPEASPCTRVAADPPGLLYVSCQLYAEPMPGLHQLQRWPHTLLRRLRETFSLVTFVLYPWCCESIFENEIIWTWFCLYAYFIVKWLIFKIKQVSLKSIENCGFCGCFFHSEVFNDAQYSTVHTTFTAL